MIIISSPNPNPNPNPSPDTEREGEEEGEEEDGGDKQLEEEGKTCLKDKVEAERVFMLTSTTSPVNRNLGTVITSVLAADEGEGEDVDVDEGEG